MSDDDEGLGFESGPYGPHYCDALMPWECEEPCGSCDHPCNEHAGSFGACEREGCPCTASAASTPEQEERENAKAREASGITYDGPGLQRAYPPKPKGERAVIPPQYMTPHPSDVTGFRRFLLWAVVVVVGGGTLFWIGLRLLQGVEFRL